MEKIKKPRIALLGSGILGGGPLGLGIPTLTDLFDRLCSDFDIVFYSFNSINTALIPKGIKVRQIYKGIPGRINFALLSGRIIRDHLVNPYSLIFAVSVYPSGKWAVRLGRLLSIRVITQIIALEAVALHDIGYGNLIIPWLAKVTRSVCEKTDVLVTVAYHQKRVAEQSLPTDRDIVVLPLRINRERFPYHKRSIAYPVQFIHIAYYSPIKDQDMMFRAFAKVTSKIDSRLVVIGDGYNVPKVHTLLAELGIKDKITFAGIVPQYELPEYLKRAHILLHPSRFETGCAAIQEAMASGVAVCGTDVGILSDIGDSYAMVVPVGNSELFAEKIMELINDPDLYDEKTERAYKWISEQGAVWSYKNYLNFLEEEVAK
jgi:glycosyltransferase involved in cell wall biosynthesis